LMTTEDVAARAGLNITDRSSGTAMAVFTMTHRRTFADLQLIQVAFVRSRAGAPVRFDLSA